MPVVIGKNKQNLQVKVNETKQIVNFYLKSLFLIALSPCL